MTHRLFWPILGAGFALFVVINLLLGLLLPGVRFDATADRLYTVSDGARQILATMPEPVRLTLYYSPVLGQQAPQYGIYTTRVQTLLREFERLSAGKLSVRVVMPEPFSEEEDAAVAAGLQGAQLGGNAAERAFFGITATNSLDGREVIPFLQTEREGFLEYDIARIIYTLSRPDKLKVGLISTLPVTGDPNSMFMTSQPSQPWVFYTQLRQVFDVTALPTATDKIPDGIRVLMLVQPQTLPEATLKAVDAFVSRGGNVLVFADPVPAATAGGLFGGETKPDTPQFAELLAHWGIKLVPGEFVSDITFAQPVNVAGAGNAAISYPGYLGLVGDALNRESPVTGNLRQLNMLEAGTLAVTAKDGITTRVLAESSDKAGLLPVDLLKPQPDVLRIVRETEPGGKHLPLAVQASGTFGAAFGGGKPAEAKPATVMVVADASLLRNEAWTQVGTFMDQAVAVPFADNGVFVLNAVDYISGDPALLNLGRGGTTSRPFTRIMERQKVAEQAFSTREQAVRQELKQTESELSTLMAQQGGGSPVLTPEQETLVRTAQQKLVQLRQDLRNIQRNLRADVERLQVGLIVLNTVLVPLLVVLVAMVMVRRKRRIF